MPDASPGALVATSLVTAVGTTPRRAPALGEPLALADAAVAWDDEGRITYVGPADGLPGDAPDPEVFAGSTLVPGFVDCHTHLPFFGWRDDEFEARLAGRSYRDLHGEGGIFRSARLLAGASDDEVLGFCRPLLHEMAAHGTTTVELKTGYGLSVDGELRQARLARRLAAEADQTCSVTLLACHAVPQGMTRTGWVRTACDELIPAAAAEALADAVDVYVEDIAFSVDDLETVAAAAASAGLPLRCHADQLGGSGAAEAAVRLGARDADHLNHVSPAGVAALASSDTVAVLLPASSAFVRSETSAPARALVDAGAAIAVASDFNPGTSPVLSMPEVIVFACLAYGLSPSEAISACTLGGAAVLGLADGVGTLEVGKRADVVVLEGEHVRRVPYRPGHDPVLATYIGGRRIGRG
jgi:imidazolonepropionase